MYDLYGSRSLFDEDHDAFRAAVGAFLSRNVTDHIEEWEHAGSVPHAVWAAAGDAGLLSLEIPEEFGGAAVTDHRFHVAMAEEFARVGATSLAVGFTCHADIVVPYLVDLANAEQSRRWLPGMASGKLIGAIAMTEPGTGSDLRRIRTMARHDGDGWVLNGSKTFISNGINADMVIVVARTGSDPTAGAGALSLFVVETGALGFTRGRKLDKIGLKAQDTAELSFEDVRLKADALLGEEGAGLSALTSHLPLERMSIAVSACAGARAALAWTIEYVHERTAFGKAIADFQNTRFAIAEMVTELEVTQAYVDGAILRLSSGDLSAVDAAKAKWWSTEMHKRTVDRCLQLHGGYGYVLDYPIARAYADTRVTTIYGGTTEIMKSMIAQDVLGSRS